MNFQGQELISRATYVSNRSLMALALAKIMTLSTGLNLDGFTLLGITPGEANLGKITDYMLIFLVINHLLSWFGDYRSFRAWNRPSRVVPKGTIGTQMTKPVTNLEYLAEHMTGQIKQVDTWIKDPTNEPAESLILSYRELTLEAVSLVRETNKLTFHAALYLWGWFLALPLFATICALCL